MPNKYRFFRKHLLGLEDLTREEIITILDTAESFKEVLTRDIKKVPTLRGKTIINFFHEPSTRTRISFEIAGKRLSADTINMTASGSSISKGESLFDTLKTLEAMKPDILVIRHSAPGALHQLAPRVNFSIINAGDGAHEHPTQALLDMLTIRDRKKHFKHLTIAIVGDITHSRVARSNIYGLSKMGVTIHVIGPPTMIPLFIENLGVKVFHSLEEGIEDADIIMMLRIQLERQNRHFFPTLREYSKLFGLNLKKLKKAKKDVIIMHPGPINRGIEIDPDVADSRYSLILDQVTNGIAVRMALLYLFIGRI
ncbi:MAG: aspartate carbamoyltransferase catalytic subunit [bacterium]